MLIYKMVNKEVQTNCSYYKQNPNASWFCYFYLQFLQFSDWILVPLDNLGNVRKLPSSNKVTNKHVKSEHAAL